MNGDGSGDGVASSSRYGNKDGDGEINEDGIGEGEGEAMKRKKPHKNCKRDVGIGGGRVVWRDKTKCKQESIGSVAAYPDNLENGKEA